MPRATYACAHARLLMLRSGVRMRARHYEGACDVALHERRVAARARRDMRVAMPIMTSLCKMMLLMFDNGSIVQISEETERQHDGVAQRARDDMARSARASLIAPRAMAMPCADAAIDIDADAQRHTRCDASALMLRFHFHAICCC